MNELIKYYAKNNFYTQRKIKEIRRFEKLGSDELLRTYNDRFIHLFRKAWDESPFYKKLYTLHHGIRKEDIKDLSDLKKLPVINRLMIRDHIEDIYNGFSFMKQVGLTSGTSGTPLKVYRSFFDICTEQAYILNYRAKYGYQLGQPLLSIRGMLGKNEPYQYFKKANTLYISSPNINSNTIEMYHKMVKDFNPVAVEAYPSYLHKFSIELERKGLSLSIPNAFTSSETLMDYQRAMIEPFLNTSIHDWYGNAERTILLAQDVEKNYRTEPLYSINEFEADRVVTTNLINCCFPLIRYQVDDRISVESADFKENLIHPTIIKIDGRQSDNLDLKDGSVVGCIDHAFKGINHLEIAQVHQYDVHEPIRIKLVVKKDFSKSDEEQLKRNFIRMVGGDMPLQFIYCDRNQLTFSKSGKYNLIIKKKPE